MARQLLEDTAVVTACRPLWSGHVLLGDVATLFGAAGQELFCKRLGLPPPPRQTEPID